MTLDVNTTDQRMYYLADFTGCKLTLAKGSLTGSGKWKQDCGLFTAKMNALVLDSIAGDNSTQPMVFILMLSGELALGIYFEPATMCIKVLVLRQSELGDKPSEFFYTNACILPHEGFSALRKHGKKMYQGKLREKLLEVPVKA